MATTQYVVLGATGHVGSVVANRLVGSGRQVRVVARGIVKLIDYSAHGAEVVPGSVEDKVFLRRAFDGAHAAFVMLPPYFGTGVRAWQDRTAAGIGDAIEAAGVRAVVTLSSIGGELASDNGPVAGLHALEQRLDRIPGLDRLHLRPGYFFENALGLIGMIRALGFVGGAIRGNLKMAQIAARDIGEVAARRLLALDWKGREVRELHGERDLTMEELTAALGAAIGNPELRYAEIPYADARAAWCRAGIPEELASLFVEMAKGFNEGKVHPTHPRSPSTTTQTPIERWAAEVFAPAFAASAPRAEAEGRATHA